MTMKFKARSLAVAVSAALSANAWAVEPQAIDIGGFRFIPTLNISENHDDNIFAEENNEQSSWVTSITPTFVLSAETAKSGYQIKYSLDRDISIRRMRPITLTTISLVRLRSPSMRATA